MKRRTPEQRLRDSLREQIVGLVRRRHPHGEIVTAWLGDGRPAAYVVNGPAYTLGRGAMLG